MRTPVIFGVLLLIYRACLSINARDEELNDFEHQKGLELVRESQHRPVEAEGQAHYGEAVFVLVVCALAYELKDRA